MSTLKVGFDPLEEAAKHLPIVTIVFSFSGPMGVPDLAGAAETVRDVFGRMDWHGRELVALIGGGHTFGCVQ